MVRKMIEIRPMLILKYWATQIPTSCLINNPTRTPKLLSHGENLLSGRNRQD